MSRTPGWRSYRQQEEFVHESSLCLRDDLGDHRHRVRGDHGHYARWFFPSCLLLERVFHVHANRGPSANLIFGDRGCKIGDRVGRGSPKLNDRA